MTISRIVELSTSFLVMMIGISVCIGALYLVVVAMIELGDYTVHRSRVARLKRDIFEMELTITRARAQRAALRATTKGNRETSCSETI